MAVHRVNEDSIWFVGSGDDLIRMAVESKSEREMGESSLGLSKEVTSADAEKGQVPSLEILRQNEDVIVPTLTVTCSQLQMVWKQGFVPRQLDCEDPSFVCFMSRCRRKQLILFIQRLLSLSDPSDITHIIHCVDAYYLVFRNNAAPNRERWKKYKSKVTAKEMNLNLSRVQMKVSEGVDYEQLRTTIEQMSHMYVREREVMSRNATLYVNMSVAYVVGDAETVRSLGPQLGNLL